MRVPDPARLALRRRLRLLDVNETAQWRGLVTFHRAETLGNEQFLTSLVAALERIGATWPLTVVLYAATRFSLMRAGLLERLSRIPGVSRTSTLPIAAYARELRSARFVITDSSGVQDDCETVGCTCLVVRRASPRPITSPLHLVDPHELDAARVESVGAAGGSLASAGTSLLLGQGAAEAIVIAKRRSRIAGDPQWPLAEGLARLAPQARGCGTVHCPRRVAGNCLSGASRTRTGDLLGAIQALSQLSYSPACSTRARERRSEKCSGQRVSQRNGAPARRRCLRWSYIWAELGSKMSI